MAITADVIIERAQKTLLDETGETWTESELIDYLNAAISFLILNKPDVASTTIDFTLTANNSLQSLPEDGIQLVEVVRNVNGKAITQIKRNIANSNNPNWPIFPTTYLAIDHFIYDERNPTKFYVQPVPTVALSVELVYIKQPERLTAVTDPLPVADIYEVPLHFLTVSMSYMKNTKRGDLSKSNNYLTLAANLLGVKLQMQGAYSPKTVINDNPSTGE